MRSLLVCALVLTAAHASAQVDAGSIASRIQRFSLSEACPDAPCETYDEAVAALRAAAEPYCVSLAIGTCGAFRFVVRGHGLGGATRYFDSAGRLVAATTYDDQLQIREWGDVPECVQVTTEELCVHDATAPPPRTAPTRAELVAAIDVVAPAIAACLTTDAPAVTLAIALRPSGTVASVRPDGTSLPRAVRRCVVAAARALVVGRFAGPRVFTFRHPFHRAP
jgi:hypothetical protein